MRPLYLLTDFGLTDPFVGIMKAVVQGIAPGCLVTDLTHGVPPQDVVRASVDLEDAAPYLPEGAVACAVVDPGVGTSRLPLLVEWRGRLLVAPDNGLLTPFLDELSGAWEITERAGAGHRTSATFHGRDIFAPAAARAARGDDPASFCRAIEDTGRLLRLEEFHPVPSARGLLLRVIGSDHFGNLTLNLRRADGLVPADAERDVSVRIGDTVIKGFGRTYAEAPIGKALLYWNSADRLEVGVNRGSAADRFRLAPGGRVFLYLPEGHLPTP